MEILVLEPGRTKRNYWGDVWANRELLTILAWRDIAVRYKQTVLGIGWAVIRPLLTTLILTIVFGRLARIPTEGEASYPIVVFAGILPWFLFSTILADASNSVVSNASLIEKVYFPRIIIPLASSGVAIVDFSLNMLMLVGIMCWYGYMPGLRIMLLPIFIAFAVLSAFGPALVAAALNVKYRDFRFIVPFVVQLGLYISPVGFSSRVVPPQWQFWYSLNPMVGVIDGFRWCILGHDSDFSGMRFLISFGIASAFACLGIAYFRRTERSFADVI